MAKNLMSVFNQGGKAAGAPETAAPDAEGGATQSVANRLPVMVLGKTLTFKGELYADEDLMLFGRVEGAIEHTASLTVGIGGVVIGDIHAKNITIKGTVEGDLEATESITIAPTANVLGDLAAPRVSIVEGAKFNGAVEMTAAPVASEPEAVVAPSGETVLSEGAVEKILGER